MRGRRCKRTDGSHESANGFARPLELVVCRRLSREIVSSTASRTSPSIGIGIGRAHLLLRWFHPALQRLNVLLCGGPQLFVGDHAESPLLVGRESLELGQQVGDLRDAKYHLGVLVHFVAHANHLGHLLLQLLVSVLLRLLRQFLLFCDLLNRVLAFFSAEALLRRKFCLVVLVAFLSLRRLLLLSFYRSLRRLLLSTLHGLLPFSLLRLLFFFCFFLRDTSGHIALLRGRRCFLDFFFFNRHRRRAAPPRQLFRFRHSFVFGQHKRPQRLLHRLVDEGSHARVVVLDVLAEEGHPIRGPPQPYGGAAKQNRAPH
mmetsp:Transcript_42054/g.119406  ORF Transcript_42054/g.119406 Transcript_42054/m.119406 type:complete len:315 (-) Transcript_42054:173-1117(-)